MVISNKFGATFDIGDSDGIGLVRMLLLLFDEFCANSLIVGAIGFELFKSKILSKFMFVFRSLHVCPIGNFIELEAN